MEDIVAEEVRVENPEADYETLKKDFKVNATAEDAAQLRAEDVVVQTKILNLSKYFIHRIDKHFWAGRATTDRTTIASGTYTILERKGTKPAGVKFGEVWANGDDSTARKWVFAFDSAGKAYAEAGPIGPVDWNVVEVKLGMSENKSVYKDPILGGETVAEIDGIKAYATFR